jgi:hypothetical protein
MIFDAGGRYANVIGKRDRPKLSSRDRTQITPADIGKVALAFAANAGTWSVNEADKTMVRKYEAAFVPNNDGMEFKLAISLTGDQLQLTDSAPAVGGTTVSVYRRAK